MAGKYVLDREPEIERLERQATLIGLDRVRDHIPGPECRKMLDAGCGSGWVSRLFAQDMPDVTVTGIDLTQSFVDYATRRAEQEELSNLSFVAGDITDLPFDAECFDFVWSQLVIFFLPEPERALTEFARVLQPGGKVKVAVTGGPFQMIWPQRPALSGPIQDLRETVLHGWRMARVPHMLEAAGFQDITIEVATDRVHSFNGGASPEQRRNIEESYLQAIGTYPEMVGGKTKADRLARELVEFVDSPASISMNTHWVFGGTKSNL